MQVSGILDPQVGFALFDAWLHSVTSRRHAHRCHNNVESPLIDAAFQAFNAYAATVETQNAAQIAALIPQIIGYSSNGQSAQPLTTQDIAPFLALNIMA